MKSNRLPSIIELILNNDIVGKISILDLDSKRFDSNLMPFINDEDNNGANESSIEIIQEDTAESTQRSSNILVLEKSLSESELFNLKRWILFRTLIERLLLYVFIIILIIFHI
jgi:hypothetical protein